MNMRKYLPPFIYAALVLIAVVMLVIFYWNVQPTDVLAIKNEPYPVRPSVVNPNGVVIVTVDYCKLQSVDGTLVIRFVGRKSVVRSPESPERAAADCQKRDLPLLLPPQLAQDTYHIEFLSTYHINPITTVDEVSRSQEFTVH